MNNKFVYRILGAVASAMVIVSVFIPFFSISGFSQSIWEINENFIFLPILIIAFGLIGVIVFSINKKIEFAYATSGAMIFYSMMRTFEIINADQFGSLSVGYYVLCAGSILTGVMAYLCNVVPKEIIDNIDMTQTTNNINMSNLSGNNVGLNNNADSLVDMSNFNSIQGMNPLEQPVSSDLQPLNEMINPAPQLDIPSESGSPEQINFGPEEQINNELNEIPTERVNVPSEPVISSPEQMTFEPEEPMNNQINEIPVQPLDILNNQVVSTSEQINVEPVQSISNQVNVVPTEQVNVSSESIISTPEQINVEPVQPMNNQINVVPTPQIQPQSIAPDTFQQPAQPQQPINNQQTGSIVFDQTSQPMINTPIQSNQPMQDMSYFNNSSNVTQQNTSNAFDIFNQPINRN